MTLDTKFTDAGWREIDRNEDDENASFVAERYVSLPGQTASTLRIEADSASALNDAVALRESQLTGRLEDVRDVITNDGSRVTDAQHEALKAEGVTVADAEQVAKPVPNEDEAKQVAGLGNGGFNPETPLDPTEGSVNAPQVPADAADQGLSPEAISASETGSGSADTSTQPEARALPASFPPPEGHEDLSDLDAAATGTEEGDSGHEEGEDGVPEVAPEDAGQPLDHGTPDVPVDAVSDGAESQSTPSADVDATDAAKAHAEENGIDLSTLTGSGKDGRVTKEDVEAAIQAKSE